MSGPIRSKLGPIRNRLQTQTTDAVRLLTGSKSLDVAVASAMHAKLSNTANVFNAALTELQSAVIGFEAEEARLQIDLESFTTDGLDAGDAVNELAAFINSTKEKLTLDRNSKADDESRKLASQNEFSLRKLQLENEKTQLENQKIQLESDHKRDFELRKLQIDNEHKLQLSRQEEELKILAETERHRVESGLPSSTQSTSNRHTSTVKLPKLELPKFNGEITKWQEFWDAFDSSVNQNTQLQPVDKFNYLKAELGEKAKAAIAGLELTNSNYDVAVQLLKERFGKKDTIIEAHYAKLFGLPSSSNSVHKLRTTYDAIEQHLRALESLGEDVNQSSCTVTVIKSKLPSAVLIELEKQRVEDESWTAKTLRERLRKLISAQEAGCLHTSDSTQPDKHESSSATERSSFYKPRNTTEALYSAEKKAPLRPCFFCNRKHWSDECRTVATAEARKAKMKGNCFICLRSNHLAKDCKVDRQCVYCQKSKSHHRSLCAKQFPSKEIAASAVDQTVPPSTPPSSSPSVDNSLLAIGERVVMQTAEITVTNANRTRAQTAGVLFDSGSGRTYITEQLVKSLKLDCNEREVLTVFTFGALKPRQVKTSVVEFKLILKDNSAISVKANVLPKITGHVPRGHVDLKQIGESMGLPLVSLARSSDISSVDLLIGNDYYAEIFTSGRIEVERGLYLLRSRVGWIPSGRVQSQDTEPHLSLLTLTNSMITTEFHNGTSIDHALDFQPNVEDMWKLETIGITDSIHESDDDKAWRNFEVSVKWTNGRYEVTWPWISDNPDLPENKLLALGRLRSLHRKLINTPNLLEEYDKIIQLQLKKGMIELVTADTPVGPLKHYIPHQAVITPQKSTTKVRIVYDASAKTRKGNKSLNECLYRGPVILEDLCGLLIRFRTHEIAITADIEKAFLQVGLQTADRDVTRFFWLKNPMEPVTENNLQIYRFTRVPFGVISSPFLLGATIIHHLKSTGSDIAKAIMHHIYVDNLIIAVANKNEAVELYKFSKKSFGDAAMNLREWGSNSIEFLEMIAENDRLPQGDIKVLGLKWNMRTDTLAIQADQMNVDETVTKRHILHVVSSIFDPLGFFTPVTLKAKIFLQTLWKKKKEWDDPLDKEDSDEFDKINTGMLGISNVAIPRFIGIGDKILLGFCDASAKAYAAVLYIKSDSEVHIVFAKSRVAPVKPVSIPRLELMAMVLGVRCLNFVQRQLKLPSIPMVLWSDSQCVLHWIKSCKPMAVFVQNRLNEITQSTGIGFRYIHTSHNPADMATKGVTVDEIQNNDLWWYGPSWLKETSEEWPTWDVPEITEEQMQKVNSESKTNQPFFEASLVVGEGLGDASPKSPFEIAISKFSSLSRLLRITAWANRFVRNTRKPNELTRGNLNADEIEEANNLWVKYSQHGCNDPKQHGLKNQLGLRVDDKEIIRCHGRLVHPDLGNDAIFPMLLLKGHPLTKLIVEDYHRKLFHAGESHTLAQIRHKYWIPKGRSEVKSVLENCLICRRHQGGPFSMPLMSPWPREKVTVSTPFTHAGLDYLGPLYTKTATGTQKVWVCLFTCVSTRAVHLELVTDMTAKQFLLALRRFISRRGAPNQIILDNAPQFKVAKTAIDRAWASMVNDTDVVQYTTSRSIRWSPIVQLAPWIGGFYERLVGIVKKALRKSIGRVCLSSTELQTILVEIEAVINSRPLVYVGESIDSGFTLTPADFLIANNKTGTPTVRAEADADYEETADSGKKLIDNWAKGQRHLNNMWNIWRDEYLLSLRERYQRRMKSPRIQSHLKPQPGNVVLVKDPRLPRGAWKIANIEGLIESRDGEFRAATILLPNKRRLKRPLNLLFPLECGDIPMDKGTAAEEMSNNVPQGATTVDEKGGRPSRNAKTLAKKRLADLLEDEMDDTLFVGSVAKVSS